MITPLISLLWLAIGTAAGCLHAAWLYRACTQPSRSLPASGMLRFLLVSATLCSAALAGGLIAAAIGWACGFVVTAITRVRRSTP